MLGLIVRVEGDVVESNFPSFKDVIIEKIEKINLNLQTEEDFAHGAEIVKMCTGAEKAIKQAKKDAMANTSSIRNLFVAMEEVLQRLGKTRKTLNRQLQKHKAEVRQGIINDGLTEISRRIAESKYLKVVRRSFHINNASFEAVIKNKKKDEKMRQCIADHVDAVEQEYIAFAQRVTGNIEYLQDYQERYPTLLNDNDWEKLVLMDWEAMKDIVNNRVSRFKAEEQSIKDRLEREKEQKPVSPAPGTEPESMPAGKVTPLLIPDTQEKPQPPPITAPPVMETAAESAGELDESFVMVIRFQGSRELAIDVVEEVEIATEYFEDNIVGIDLNRADAGTMEALESLLRG